MKLVDTGVSLTAFLAFAGISETSTLGKAIKSVGKRKLASAAKKIVTGLGGISLIPSLSKFILNAIRESSNNYTTGIRVIVTWSDRGCYTNNYTSWDGYSNSIYGREYCRGKFSKYTKLRGWY